MSRPSKNQRRAQPALQRLAAIQQRLHDGEDLALADRRWLANLLANIMDDVDVRELFYQTLPHRLANQDRPFWAAMWIAHRAQPHGRMTVTDAKAVAEGEWKMSEEKVRRAWLAHARQARAILAGSKNPADAWRRLIDQHRHRLVQ